MCVGRRWRWAAGGEEEAVWEDLERQGEDEEADACPEEEDVASEQESAEAPERAAWQARQQVPL